MTETFTYVNVNGEEYAGVHGCDGCCAPGRGEALP